MQIIDFYLLSFPDYKRGEGGGEGIPGEAGDLGFGAFGEDVGAEGVKLLDASGKGGGIFGGDEDARHTVGHDFRKHP